jgi:phosphatidylglycerol:prolipoprotein diacylglycerol transferase
MRPVLFWIPLVHLPIYSYGVMLGLSLIVGWYIVLGLCERDGMDREKMGTLYMWTAISSVTSARLLYVLTNLDRFDNFFDIFKVWQGGLVAYGGFCGGFLFGVGYCLVKKIRLLAWADNVVPSLGSGLAITRMGCLLYGCDFGRVMEPAKWWAVRFPKDSPAWAEQVKQGLLASTELHSLPVHPTQIYESLVGVALLGITLLVRRYRTFSGQVFCAFTMSYGVLRFYIETLRADEQRNSVGPFSTSQFIGIVTFLLAGGLLIGLWRWTKSHPGSLRYWEQTVEATPALSAAQAAAKTAANKKKRARKK